MSSEPRVAAPKNVRSEAFPYISANGSGEGAANGATPGERWIFGEPSKKDLEERERQAFENGARQGEERARAAFEKEAAALRGNLAGAIAAFQNERGAYFARIEPEVVQLALAIARKILHREAQIDPLLLAGMVRVALEKLDSRTCVRMRVHPGDIHGWNEYFALSAPQLAPELVGDAELQHCECALETEIGSTQISLETQLKEIEQGFFDLLDQRPKAR